MISLFYYNNDSDPNFDLFHSKKNNKVQQFLEHSKFLSLKKKFNLKEHNLNELINADSDIPMIKK